MFYSPAVKVACFALLLKGVDRSTDVQTYLARLRACRVDQKVETKTGVN